MLLYIFRCMCALESPPFSTIAFVRSADLCENETLSDDGGRVNVGNDSDLNLRTAFPRWLRIKFGSKVSDRFVLRT